MKTNNELKMIYLNVIKEKYKKAEEVENFMKNIIGPTLEEAVNKGKSSKLFSIKSLNAYQKEYLTNNLKDLGYKVEIKENILIVSLNI